MRIPRTSTRKRLVVAVAVVALVAVMTAACSSSPGSSAPAAGPGVSDANKAKLESLVAEAMKPRTEAGLGPKLATPPEPGKKIIYLQCPSGCEPAYAGLQSAGAALKWDVSSVSTGNTPEQTAQAVDQAISQKPDGIVLSGQDCTQIPNQCQRAKSANIPLVTSTVLDSVWKTPDSPIIGSYLSADFTTKMATQEAEWVALDAAKNGTTPTILNVYTTAYSIVKSMSDTFTATLKQYCPNCKVVSMNVQLSEIGSALPGKLVAASRAQKVDYLWLDALWMGTGVIASFKQAGIELPKVLGTSPAETDYQGMVDGTVAATSLFPIQVGSWYTMDALARDFQGLPVVDSNLNPQLQTQDSLSSKDAKALYVDQGIADYQKQFKAVWGVS